HRGPPLRAALAGGGGAHRVLREEVRPRPRAPLRLRPPHVPPRAPGGGTLHPRTHRPRRHRPHGQALRVGELSFLLPGGLQPPADGRPRGRGAALLALPVRLALRHHWTRRALSFSSRPVVTKE